METRPSETLGATAPNANPKATGDGQSIGRGGAFLSLAKLYFVALGLAQQIALSWVLQNSYGALRGALSPASITYNPLVATGVQGLSRVVSQQRAGAATDSGVQAALICQMVLGTLAAAGFFVIAPWLGIALHSPHLVGSFRILAVTVLCYGIYAPLVGVLNGQRRFVAQAGLDVFAVTLRTVALITGAYWFGRRGEISAVEGACSGFALMSVGMVLVAFFVARPRLKASLDMAELRRHLAYVLPLLGSQAVLNLLLQADTNMLRAFATRAATSAGLGLERADLLVGAYGAGQLFAFLPYQLLMGVNFILFPLLSEAQARSERAAMADLVSGGIRIAAISTGLVVSVSAGLSEGLLRLVFPPQFAENGAESMRYLCIGLGFFALFGVFSAILNSLGRQWAALTATASALGLVLALNWLTLSGATFGSELLVRTALSSSVGVVLATALAGYWVWRHTGALLSVRSVLRIVVAISLAVALGRSLPVTGKLLTVAAAVGVGVAYVGMLLLLRELTEKDARGIARLFRRAR